MYIFVCEDSAEGIFSGVYDACASRLGQKNIRLMTGEPENLELFCEYRIIEPSFEKSSKVARTIQNRFGREFYESIYQAVMSRENSSKNSNGNSAYKAVPDKADAVYRTILLALSCNDGQRVLLSLGEPCVMRVFELCRATNREACHLLGFLRFKELQNGVLFATVHPKNNVLPYLAEHFTDRLALENFMILDETRHTVAVHKAGKDYLLADAADLDPEALAHCSTAEEKYQRLWFAFCDSAAIPARANPALQMQLMPKRYWADTPELSRLL